MINCKCDAPDVEFTVVKDELSGIVLIQAVCLNCGKSASSFATSVEQAHIEVEKEWKKKRRSGFNGRKKRNETAG